MVTLNEDQQKGMEKLEAFRLRTKNLESSNLFFLLEGWAGSGKTTLAAEWADNNSDGLVVLAPTHKAKKVIARKIDSEDITFDTIHAFCGLREDILPDGSRSFIPSGKDKSAGCRKLIIEESSMVNTSLLGYVKKLSYDNHIPIVFVGDGGQLPPIGEAFSPVFDSAYQQGMNMEVLTLNSIVRQAEGSPIIKAARNVRLMGENVSYRALVDMVTPEVTDMGQINFMSNSNKFIDRYLENSDTDHAKITSWHDYKVTAYNSKIRRILHPTFTELISPGDRIILKEPLTEGEQTLLDNNTEGVIVSTRHEVIDLGAGIQIPSYECVIAPDDMKETFKIYVPTEEGKPIYDNLCTNLANRAKTFPKGSLMAKGAWRDFYAFKRLFIEWQHGYAMTVHRSQGSTFTHCLLDMADMWKNPNTYERNKLIYTAITRASTSVNIIW